MVELLKDVSGHQPILKNLIEKKEEEWRGKKKKTRRRGRKEGEEQ